MHDVLINGLFEMSWDGTYLPDQTVANSQDTENPLFKLHYNMGTRTCLSFEVLDYDGCCGPDVYSSENLSGKDISTHLEPDKR